MKGIIKIMLSISLLTNCTMAQEDTGVWDNYIANYENNKPGSTLLRMDLIKKVPLKNYAFVLITGVTYESSRPDGFPDSTTLNTIQHIGDDLEQFIKKNFDGIYVGSFTHDLERLEYFYIKSDEKVENKLKVFYKEKYPLFKYYINIKEDSQWAAYTDFLYPNEDILNYMSDEKVVAKLQEEGDDLSKSRRVDHWAYFNSMKEAEQFKIEVEKQGFKVESIEKNEDSKLPIEVEFWREDFVSIDSIYAVTTNLRSVAQNCKGDYDGWETMIMKK